MGGLQRSVELAYPEFMDLGIPIVGSPQSTSFDKLLWTAQSTLSNSIRLGTMAILPGR